MKARSSSIRAGRVESSLKPLFVAGLAGDGAAYAAFLTRLAVHLRGFYRRQGADVAMIAEDLVQEVLLSVHLKRGTWLASEPLLPWLIAIARHKAIDWRRSRGRRIQPLSFDEVVEPAGENPAETAGIARDLDGLLDTLPERQAAAMRLVRIEGFTMAEAARRTGQTEGAVKVGMHRALKALQTLVLRRGEAGS